MFRYQPPAFSPLPAAAVGAGCGGLLAGGDGAERAVRTALEEVFGPVALVLTDSGTTALTLALRAVARLHPGRGVLLPAYGCYDLATAAVGAGVAPWLYDLDPDTLGPDLDQVRAGLHDGAAAVVVVHLYGMPVDMTPLMSEVEAAGAILVDDAAQGYGATVAGRPLGGWGMFGVLSFGRGKGVTGGGGGALLVHDPRGAEALPTCPEGRPRGWTRLAALTAQWALARPGWYAIPSVIPMLHLGETRYHEPGPPASSSAVSLAVLSHTLPLAREELETRRSHAARLRDALADRHEDGGVREVVSAAPGYLRFPMVGADARGGAEGIRRARPLGVMPGYPLTLRDLPALARLVRNATTPFPGAEQLVRDLYTLPTHSRLGARGVDRVIAWLRTSGR